ncbi:hypothetical protein A3I34_02370 [Candidatus Jorgensenbacteria bacterium RIFCSPLOWO2_02_FULL_45_12]|uniref:Homing endonuclease LAGLIDADG domain-containing protein n=2 Tax=Candidatus Joergenseniibacteriota TaxID=1752739 RepID=A0A1F6BNT8_9BACT|nr:MAG: hypothetical protein UX22_C0026G0016 [Candidatus Jorgensenbacteria bacterium GW2011_GWA2_45_9]OGG38594.1 MAG: hypothetical protein A3D55_01870 [Candidatus Jorgensenbacteria bacterium RIFCSPHIGHO2_02_FULL_45_20]OGG42201.1 MAG: hypothetical protein A3I34_02370 [Candidatus Jorgensenbacteria bacterium RIFCSPLOWO2_02_FULL_45_12]
MAKPQQKTDSWRMRRNGMSIGEISKQLKVSKSSVSEWCKEIRLTRKQTRNLKNISVAHGLIGRQIGSQIQKDKKIKIIKFYEDVGKKKIANEISRGFFMLGIGLYLGEGNKNGNRFQMTNSNPYIIKSMIEWLSEFFNTKTESVIPRIMINESHKDRELSVIRFWSKTTNIPVSQFRKTVFIKSKHKKVYENRDFYFGTFVLRIEKSSRLQYEILGLCKATLEYFRYQKQNRFV